jgi:hypothetical protein
MLADVFSPMVGSCERGSRLRCGDKIPAVFVTHAHSLSASPGGLQICTREYLQTIHAAGFAPIMKEFEHDNRLVTRFFQRVSSTVYKRQWRPALVEEIVTAARQSEARFVFLNLVNLAPLVHPLRARLVSGTKIVLLSHGLESVDFLHTAAQVKDSLRVRSAASMLGRQLLAEYDQRREIDHVFCLSPVEAEVERWLGAKSVTWLPRTVPKRPPLCWRPERNRIGFVGTLDHPPNKEGLIQFLEALESIGPRELEVRVAGGPVAEGKALSARFRMVKYLGALTNDSLESEAATWSCFVHPLFRYARGCSTKLAIALSWQIPVATTFAGCRGYVWRAGKLPQAKCPESLGRLAVDLTEPGVGNAAREEIRAIVDSTPGIDAVADLLSGALIPDENAQR